MGYDKNKKYYIADDGSIYKVNEDGSFTKIGNISELKKHNSNKIKDWILINYNWLYCISLILLLVSSGLCILNQKYHDSELLATLSLCAGSVSIVVPWIFKQITRLVETLLLVSLIVSFITIITFSPEWLYSFQILIGFCSVFVYCVILTKQRIK